MATEIITRETLWASPKDFMALLHKDIIEGHITIKDLQGKLAHVEVYVEGGKMRAFCETCQRDDCIHAYFAVDMALRKIVKKELEVEYVNILRVSKAYKSLTKEQKKEILRKLGIDLKDLREYINHIGKKNAPEIATWRELMCLPKRFLY